MAESPPDPPHTDEPPTGDPPERARGDVPPRAFYYPGAPTGCLFWLLVALILYVLIGSFLAPPWYPWWGR